MIARPKVSQNEWKTAEKGAFEVGNFALLSCPDRRRLERAVREEGPDGERAPQERLRARVAREAFDGVDGQPEGREGTGRDHERLEEVGAPPAERGGGDVRSVDEAERLGSGATGWGGGAATRGQAGGGKGVGWRGGAEGTEGVQDAL